MKENEQLQGRLSDMKVTLQENKALMADFIANSAAAAEASAPASAPAPEPAQPLANE